MKTAMLTIALIVLTGCMQEYDGVWIEDTEASIVSDVNSEEGDIDSNEIECHPEVADNEYFVSAKDYKPKPLNVDSECGEYIYLIEQAIDDLNYIAGQKIYYINSVCDFRECYDPEGPNIVMCKYGYWHDPSNLGIWNGYDIKMFMNNIEKSSNVKEVSFERMFMNTVKHEIVHMFEGTALSDHTDNKEDIMYLGGLGNICYSEHDVKFLKETIKQKL